MGCNQVPLGKALRSKLVNYVLKLISGGALVIFFVGNRIEIYMPTYRNFVMEMRHIGRNPAGLP